MTHDKIQVRNGSGYGEAPRPDHPLPNERDEGTLGDLARQIEKEIEALLRASLPPALARQWEGSPVPKPREDTAERSSGGRPANPTADVVLDGRRLAVRDAVTNAEGDLRRVVFMKTRLARLLEDLRQDRRDLDRAVARFDGEESAA